MTIAGLAKELNISQQAIYQRLKRKGINLESIQEDGNLTDEGENLIRELYSASRENQLNNTIYEHIKRLEELSDCQLKLNDAKHNIDKLEKQVESLREELANRDREREQRETETEQVIARLREQIQSLEADKGFLQSALHQEQETHRQTMLLLMPPKREGLIDKLKGRFISRKEN